MSAAALVARADARRRIASGIALAVLIGVASGAVFAAWAGARRTGSAHQRILDETHAADVTVTREGGDADSLDPRIVKGAPGMIGYGIVDGYGVFALDDGGLPALESGTALLVSRTGEAFFDIDRQLVVKGRRADPESADELMVDRFGAAHGYGIGPTKLCIFNFYDAGPFEADLTGGATPTPKRLKEFRDQVCDVRSMRVVGVMRSGTEGIVNEASADQTFMYGTPALSKKLGPPAFGFSQVDLAPDADVDAFVDYLLERAPADAGISVQSTALERTVVARTVEPAVRALQLFALIGALASLGVLGPALFRWTSTAESEVRPLLAMGLRRRQLRVISCARSLVVGLIASAVAAAIAIAASGRFPVGIARRLEPHPGTRVDAVVLAIGVLVVMVSCAGIGMLAPLTRTARPRQPSRLGSMVSDVGARPSVVTGVQAAFSRDAGGPGPIATLGGVAVALAAVAAALSFQASMTAMLDQPARWGWTWDALADGIDEPLPDDVLHVLRTSTDVTALMVGEHGGFSRDGDAIPAYSFEPVRGHIGPTIVHGRAPCGAAEVAFGAQTMHRLHVGIGDQVELRTPTGSAVAVRVVGQTLIPIPAVGQELTIGEGALIDAPLMEKAGVGGTALAAFRLREGVSRSSFAASLGKQNKSAFQTDLFLGPSLTGDLRGYDSVRRTPVALAGLLALLGAGVLAHTIAGSASRPPP